MLSFEGSARDLNSSTHGSTANTSYPLSHRHLRSSSGAWRELTFVAHLLSYYVLVIFLHMYQFTGMCRLCVDVYVGTSPFAFVRMHMEVRGQPCLVFLRRLSALYLIFNCFTWSFSGLELPKKVR